MAHTIQPVTPQDQPWDVTYENRSLLADTRRTVVRVEAARYDEAISRASAQLDASGWCFVQARMTGPQPLRP